MVDRARPLAGKRIVVTRSRHQSAEFCAQLSALGAVPIKFPVIKLRALPTNALRDAMQLHHYDWLIFTSANAVQFFFATNPFNLQDVAIATVGEATHAALAARGYSADFIPQRFSGAALAREIPLHAGQRILLPRAQGGQPELVALLRARGATVDDIPLYKTLCNTVSAEQIIASTTADAVTFTSPSSVRNFLTIMPRHALPISVVIACIGPTTARAARQRQLTVNIVPSTYTIPNLITALVAFWQREHAP